MGRNHMVARKPATGKESSVAKRPRASGATASRSKLGNGMKTFSMHAFDKATVPMISKLSEERDAHPSFALTNATELAQLDRPMLVAWRQLREQIVAFDKAIRALVKSNSACRLLMSVPGIGVLSALAYVSTVEDQ